MAESDPANPKVAVQSPWDRAAKFIKDVGFPVAVAIFLLWDRMTVMQKFQETMAEVKLLLQDVRHEIKKGP